MTQMVDLKFCWGEYHNFVIISEAPNKQAQNLRLQVFKDQSSPKGIGQ